jgi:hypothetical protein
MTRSPLSKILKHLHLKETWVIFFILGIIMMNYPFIHIFYKSRQIFGLPALFLYLYAGWYVSICVIYLFVKAIDFPHADNGEKR